MMNRERNPRQAAAGEYDVIIIGRGIYGITLALEAGRRGIKSLLLEKGDFGEYTSFNSLKIIHGGLRYLQSLDLHRFKESVRERSWFLKHFPRLEKSNPVGCPGSHADSGRNDLSPKWQGNGTARFGTAI